MPVNWTTKKWIYSQKYTISKVNQGDTENLNRLPVITNNEIKLVVKNSQ